VEEITEWELRELGIELTEKVPGGVFFEGDQDALYRAHLWLRTANRVLLILRSFPVRTPDELYETPQSRFLADFIGDANLVDGELVVNGHGASFVAGGITAAVRADGMAAGPATLAVRPQRLRLVDAAQGVLPGVVKRASYLGSRIEYVVVTAWGELLVFDVDARTARRREDAVGVAFDRDAVIVLKR